jgi:hypothetical protein
VDKGHILNLLEVGVATATFNKHEVRNFVDDHVLPFHDKATSADAKRFFEALASRRLTPLQVSMMLMGCYGYVYHDGHHSVTNVKSTFDILQMTTIWNEYKQGHKPLRHLGMSRGDVRQAFTHTFC